MSVGIDTGGDPQQDLLDLIRPGRHLFQQRQLVEAVYYYTAYPPCPYAATIRAVEASGEWPAGRIAGRTVVIKTNLVSGKPTWYAANTDARVVRALVDLALYFDADKVFIVETSPEGARFSESGYDFFNSYDERVALVDLADWPVISRELFLKLHVKPSMPLTTLFCYFLT